MIPGTYANCTHPICDSPRRCLPLSECNCEQFTYNGPRVPLLNDASSLDITLLGVPTGRHPVSLYFLPRVEATSHAEQSWCCRQTPSYGNCTTYRRHSLATKHPALETSEIELPESAFVWSQSSPPLMPRTLPAKDMAKLSRPRIRAVP